MTKTILVTGGAGFIGRAVVKQLAERGDRVIVLDALTYAGHEANLNGIEGDVMLQVGDIAHREYVDTLFSAHQPDAILHLAAESHVDNSIASSARFIETNILGSYTLLEAARHYAQGKDNFRFVQVSTDEVYGALGEEGIFKADTALAPNSPYSASKAGGDLLARAWFKTYGLPVITTRCSNNYGPYQHPEKLIPRMITNALKGETLPVYGKGNQVRDWIHVEDHASGIIAAYEKGEAGEVYVFGGHNEIRNIEVVEAICRMLAVKQPGRDYKALITHVTDRLGHDFRYAIDDSKTIEALGWKRQTTDFWSGLEATIDWYLANPQWVDTMLKHSEDERSRA